MAKFLNREGIRESLVEVFQTSEKEVIVIVPYIKLSSETFKLLSEADDRGIELTIIYKEDKMIKSERGKLCSLKNLNLLSHPDIHTKCYCNESKMIIASMNLYDYSEKYNREMGVLFDLEEDFFSDDVYDSAIEEIRSIVKSAKLEKKSQASVNDNFNLKLLKPISDYLRLSCKIVNKYFENKTFELSSDNEIYCKDYIDNIDVIIEPNLEDYFNEDTGEFVLHRATLVFKWKDELTEKVHKQFHSNLRFDTFPNFKIYWNSPRNNLTIYRDFKKQPKWEDLTNQQTLKKYRQGIDTVIDYLKVIERRLR